MLMALLSREQGASMAEITDATGWLPHTARASISGLRKKCYAIARTRIDGIASYRLGDLVGILVTTLLLSDPEAFGVRMAEGRM